MISAEGNMSRRKIEGSSSFYYNFSERRDQFRVLEIQLEIALERNLPVSLHTRKSEDELYRVLVSFGVSRGVLHSYTGKPEIAFKAVESGLLIGVNGIITFRRAEELRGLIRELPLDKLILETDSPYLAPVPFRGKRNNPVLLGFILREVANQKGLTVVEAGTVLRRNAEILFSVT